MARKFQHQGLFGGSPPDDPNTKQDALAWLQAKPGEQIRQVPEDEEIFISAYKPELNSLEAAMEAAFRYRFLQDQAASEALPDLLGAPDQNRPTQLYQALMQAVAQAQIYEMMRPVPGERWRGAYLEYAQELLHTQANTFLDEIWMMPLRAALAIITEDEELLQEAAGHYRKVVDTLIHPEGYIHPAVEDTPENTYQTLLLSLGALSLVAEAAVQVGVDLWSYERRGVGIGTSTAYVLYYYYYPEKWRWPDDLNLASVQEAFYQHGAFMEFITYRLYVRGSGMMLEQQRPFFSVHLGGLTTLTHAPLKQKEKKGWFGFLR